jgi:hypothetical protein
MLSDDKNSPRRRYGYGWYGNAAAVAGRQARDAGRRADAPRRCRPIRNCSTRSRPSAPCRTTPTGGRSMARSARWGRRVPRPRRPQPIARSTMIMRSPSRRWPRKHGAARFALTSSMGADMHSPFRYTRTKGELEDAVIRLGFPSLTIVRPGFLGGERRRGTAAGAHRRDRYCALADPILPGQRPHQSRHRPSRPLLVEAALRTAKRDGISSAPRRSRARQKGAPECRAILIMTGPSPIISTAALLQPGRAGHRPHLGRCGVGGAPCPTIPGPDRSR